MNILSTFKRLWCCVFLLFISNYVAGQNETYAPSQLLVKFKAGVAVAQAENTMISISASVAENFENLGIQQWTLPDEVSVGGETFVTDTDMEALAEYMIENDENIELAEPNYYMSAAPTTYTSYTPNDNGFPLLWGLNNTGNTGGIADADIDALEAWSMGTGNENIIVGVLDSGIDWTHPELIHNIWQNEGEDTDGDGLLVLDADGNWIMDPDDINGIDDDGNGYVDDLIGWDFVDEDNNPHDLNGHGTHVAGTIAATGDNGVGIVGVSSQVRIMPLRFLNSDGVGLVSGAVRGLNYSMDKGVYLTNNSWGSTGVSEALRLAIEQAAEANQLFIAAAGNNGLDNDIVPNYPSSFDLDNIIAVAATNSSDQLASFSNYGVNSVDIAAPGVGILSTLPDNSYGYANGTSMAAPHAAGAAVLLWSQDLSASYTKIKDAILNSVDVIGTLSGDVATGGRLNVYQALLAMQECTAEAEFTTPTGVICPNTLQSFDDSSTDAISHAWYMNDDFLTDDENMKFTFTEPGEYNIKLVITGEGEDCVSEMIKTVFVTGPADADFNHSTSSLVVSFSPMEDNENYTYQWDFGDNSSSTEASPTHEYAEAGSYEVTVGVTNSCGGTTFQSNTVVVEEVVQVLCPIQEDIAPVSLNTTTCNNPSGNTIQLPSVEISEDFSETTVATWTQDATDLIQVEIGENNEVTLEQHLDCEVGEYNFSLTITCIEDETVILDGGTAAFSVYPQPQKPTLVRNDDECNYSVMPVCEFDEVSPTSIVVEQGDEAGTTDISVSNTGCSTASVFTVEYEACPVVVSDGCPIGTDVTPVSGVDEGCTTNELNFPFVTIDGDNAENAVVIWRLSNDPDFVIPEGQSPTIELPENTTCEPQTFVFNLNISCTNNEDIFIYSGEYTYILFPTPQAPTIERLDDECNYEVVPHCISDTVNPESLTQMPNTEAGGIEVEVSNEYCADVYPYPVSFEACPPACPAEEDVVVGEDTIESLCSSIDGNTVTLPAIEVTGDAAENAVITWTLLSPEGLEIEVPAGQSPTVTLPQNTDCGFEAYEFEASVSCSQDESVVWFGGIASYEIYPEPQAPMIEMSQDEATGTCSYLVVPFCEGDVVTPDTLDDQNHNTAEGSVTFEVSNGGCEASPFGLTIEECPTVCVLEEEFEALDVEESICNSDTNTVVLPELIIESDNADSAIYTWTQVANNAPTIEVGEGATPTVTLENNEECAAVIYQFTLTITCSKDATISYIGGTANYTLYPSPKIPTIQRVDGLEEAEECAYQVVAACGGDVLSETEFTQVAGSGETVREITVSNVGCDEGNEITFDVEFEECPALCVSEDEFEALMVEESVCNSDTNTVVLPELIIESDVIDNMIFTWIQVENGAPMIEVGESAAPTIVLEGNEECDAVIYEFALTITCSKDSTVNYNGGTATYTLFPSPKAPTIERVDGLEEAEECAYQVVAACEGDVLSETEFTQVAGSGETIREITVGNGGECEAIFPVEFEECPAIPCSWMVAPNEVKCNATSYTMCIEAVDTLSEVMGINFNMTYPEGTMLVDAEPSARFQFSDDLVDDVSSLASFSSVAPDGSLNVVVYLSDIGGTINGAGTLGCVEFQFTEEFHSDWSEASFGVNSFQESYILETKEMCVDDGLLTIDFDPGHELAFWVRGDESIPLTDDSENPITSIYTADEECATTSDENALLDENGTTIIGSSDYFKATRWVGCEPLNPVVNGDDALLTAKIVARDASYMPDIYALMAADVNDNGKVDGADISLILARSVGAICSYPVQADKDTSDWKFERYEVATGDSSWIIDPAYPFGTGQGADANNVPLASQCHYTPENTGDTCAYTFSNYVAILKGDLDSTWNQDVAMIAKSSGKLVIDLEGMAASIDDKYYIPVYYNGEKAVNSVDFRLSFNSEELNIEEVKLASTNNGSQINFAWNKYEENELLLSAYTLESQINAGKPVFYLVTSTPPSEVSASSFNTNTAMLNGLPAGIEVISDELSTGIDELTASLHQIKAYPNPANESLNLAFSSEENIEAVTYTVYDLTGRTIDEYTRTRNSNGNGNAPLEIKTSDWIAGTYMITVQDGNDGRFLAREKVLIVH
ncbi:MAG: S8 family serine peptidase [Chitinophagales bacterium]